MAKVFYFLFIYDDIFILAIFRYAKLTNLKLTVWTSPFKFTFLSIWCTPHFT